MSYISQEDYKKMMENFKTGTPKGMLKETLDPVGKEDSDIDNDGDVDKTDKYLANRRQAVGKAIGKGRMMKESDPTNDQWYEDFENGLRNLANNKYISQFELQQYMKALDHVDPMDKYSEFDGHDAAKEFVDDLRTKDQMDADDYQWKSEHGGYDFGGDDFNDGEFWENETKKLKEIAGVGPQDDGPEDDDEEEREKRRKKREMEDEEAENAERDLDEAEMSAEILGHVRRDIYRVRTISGTVEDLDFDRHIEDEVDPPYGYSGHLEATDEQGNEYVMLADFVDMGGGDYDVDPDYSSLEVYPVKPTTEGNKGICPSCGMPSAECECGEEMGEGLHMPPLQATGQTIMTNEDQAPFGLSVLSPDERKQLKEYITSIKTIKEEIAKLVGKTGKKVKEGDLGGDRTDLVMTKAEMWEGDDRMENVVNQKLKDAFEKVTGMLMKDLMEDGFDEGDIKLYLDHIIEEKAKEAINAQHD